MIKSRFEKTGEISFDLQNVRGVFPEVGRKEIDMVDTKNKISVEFNGIFWHQILNDKTENDWIKAEKMRENGFQHLALNELDLESLDILADMISPSKKVVAARKCKVYEISSQESKEFLDRNHLQGNTGSSVKLGLKFEGELVQLMTFGKSRFDKSIEWEIIRLATKRTVRVIGGSDRLFNNFLKKYQPSSVLSYSDNRYFSGDVYKKLGFVLASNTKKSNYWWAKGSKIISRHTTQKRLLSNLLDNFDSEKSEAYNMISHGWTKIYDLGNKKWILDRK